MKNNVRTDIQIEFEELLLLLPSYSADRGTDIATRKAIAMSNIILQLMTSVAFKFEIHSIILVFYWK